MNQQINVSLLIRVYDMTHCVTRRAHTVLVRVGMCVCVCACTHSACACGYVCVCMCVCVFACVCLYVCLCSSMFDHSTHSCVWHD